METKFVSVLIEKNSAHFVVMVDGLECVCPLPRSQVLDDVFRDAERIAEVGISIYKQAMNKG